MTEIKNTYEKIPAAFSPKDKKALQKELAKLQLSIFRAKRPVIILLEGFQGSAPSRCISEMIESLDPRFFQVVSPFILSPCDNSKPFLWPYLQAIPPAGKMLFLDTGWIEATVFSLAEGRISLEEKERRIRHINNFERLLVDRGYLLLKIFLSFTGEEQKKKLRDNSRQISAPPYFVLNNASWQQGHYRAFSDLFDELLDKTSIWAPWHIIPAANQKEAGYSCLSLLCSTLSSHLDIPEKNSSPSLPVKEPLPEFPQLAEKTFPFMQDQKEYKAILKELQKRLQALQPFLWKKRVPVIIAFEGWDAAGKGGTIRRISSALDPRGYEVYPISGPEKFEKERIYLWRFWTKLPPAGHIAIFDRSWYGRVLVERVEELCSPEEWKAAYREINEFEQMLWENGAILLKFWLQIDKKTQLLRFEERQQTPEKQWKITPEDWRNREKWELYEQAANDMFKNTHTSWAPWHVIPSVDKKHARLETLRIIIETVEERLSLGEARLSLRQESDSRRLQ